MTGWVVLAAGGWGLAQWMGEPSATGGPEPGTARPSGPGREPGPQPESACDDLAGASSPRPTDVASLLKASAAPDDDGTIQFRMVACDTVRITD
ncbi:hypothetical protein ACWGRV_15545 [Streptomyces sp. NPDC055663]